MRWVHFSGRVVLTLSLIWFAVFSVPFMWLIFNYEKATIPSWWFAWFPGMAVGAILAWVPFEDAKKWLYYIKGWLING